ncbi:MAG TPA: hypothetical protein VL689_05605 [Paraburkholderia sp.]|jgi:hypothetical protein|nr:hypothetical protein [Paraburkholderia sp.]
MNKVSTLSPPRGGARFDRAGRAVPSGIVDIRGGADGRATRFPSPRTATTAVASR